MTPYNRTTVARESGFLDFLYHILACNTIYYKINCCTCLHFPFEEDGEDEDDEDNNEQSIEDKIAIT